jgi:AcrR family transcriptional regulator
MLGERDTRAVRRDATRARILEAAWTLARRDGLAAVSFREVARMVGMRAPSLYTYFDSKNALYDAMYAESVTKLHDALGARREGATPEETLRDVQHAFIGFMASNPARYQIIVERPVPGFEPTPESFALAQRGFSVARDALAAVGITDERAVDMWRALNTGLLTQQIANEPGGDRWTRLVDDALDMYLAHYGKKPRRSKR